MWSEEKSKIARRFGEKHILSENVQYKSASDHFLEFRCQKLHAAVARNAFGSQNAKKLRVSEHFSKFRCQKIARRRGEKRIWKSKC